MNEPDAPPAPTDRNIITLRGLSYQTVQTLKQATDADIELTAKGPDAGGKWAGYIVAPDGRRIVSTSHQFEGPDEARGHMARVVEAARLVEFTEDTAAPFKEHGDKVAVVVEELSQKAIEEAFKPYHCKKTPTGWKIHVPVKTILDFDGKAFIVKELSKKQIVLHGEKGGLPVGQAVHIFEGRFTVRKSIPKGPNDFEVRLMPKEGTTINPRPLPQ